MKKFINGFAAAGLVALTPLLVNAQIVFSSGGGQFGTLLGNLLAFTNSVLIPFILGIGFLVFVWGMFQFFIAGGANDEAKEKGKSLIVYAVLGFVLIIVFWGIINLIVQSVTGGNSTQSLPASSIPLAPVNR
jgi:hypothetical protein